MVLSHLSRLGLQVNREKSKLSPTQRISFLGMELDPVNLTARLSEERAQSMLRCLESLQRKRAVPLKHFQRLLGHMASSAAIMPLGLLHMRPLQCWLHDRVPRWAWRHGTYRVSLTPSCRRTFSPWSDLAFLRAGVPLEHVSRQIVLSTDASYPRDVTSRRHSCCTTAVRPGHTVSAPQRKALSFYTRTAGRGARGETRTPTAIGLFC